MENSDQLSNALVIPHDLHQEVIDDREDAFICKAKYWLDCVVKGLLEFVFHIITLTKQNGEFRKYKITIVNVS